ncbi:MAG: TRAP transporter substrate-binding protein, partial [Pseudomonadota bacterium]
GRLTGLGPCDDLPPTLDVGASEMASTGSEKRTPANGIRPNGLTRRQALAGGAAATAAGTLAAPALAQAPRTLRLVGTFPRGFPGLGQSSEWFADRVNAMADGSLTVEYFGGGELVPPFGVNDAVSAGTAEIGHTAPYFAVKKIPSTMYFTTFPYGLSQSELSGWINFGGGQELWDEAYAPFKLKPLYGGGSMAQAGGWFKQPIESLADLEGLKMRIGGLGGEVMKRVGVEPVNLPPTQIFEALESGTVDAAEFVGPWNDLALGLYTVAPYYYLTSFAEPGPALEFIINLDVWDDLSAPHKAIIAAAAGAVADEFTSAFAYHNARRLTQLVERGAIISSFPAEVIAAIGTASREAIEAYPAGDPMSEKIHDGYFAYVRECARCGAAMEGQMLVDRGAVWAE